MHRCKKVYFDVSNKHLSFALAKDSMSNTYLVLNFTSFKGDNQCFKQFNGCKFTKDEMCKIAPVLIFKTPRGRSNSFIPFNHASSVDELKFKKQFDSIPNYPLQTVFVAKIQKEARKQLRGDMLKKYKKLL